MIRYLRLFAYFVRFSVSRSLEFRLDFFFRVVMDGIYYAAQLVFYKIIFLNTTMLGGWNEAQVMIFVATYLMVDAIQMTLFSNNVWWLTTFINKGDLDYYLVRPVSSLFFISTRDFATNSFLNFLMTIGICYWAFDRYDQSIPWYIFILYGYCVFLGAIIHYAIHILFTLPVFWTHSGRGMLGMFWNMGKFMERPDSIFTGWTRRILISILPFSLMASFPARVIWDSNPLEIAAAVSLGAIFSLLAAIYIWRLGLRSYSSASS